MTIRTRKSLGQHFLNDRNLLAKIAALTEATEDDVVLEVGPGPGGLTEALLDRAATVVAIERDARLLAELSRRFAGRKFALAGGDALELDWPALVAPWTGTGKRWLVAGNIPYNITSPLIARALTPPLPASVTFLVQREVADRLTAAPGDDDYGALSINIQAVADVHRGFAIPRGAFTPVPKVDSAVVRLVPRAAPMIALDRIPAFRKVVTSLFSYRRKRMLKALREATGLDATTAAAILDQGQIDSNVRPETLDVAAFVRLLDRLEGVQLAPGRRS